MTGDGHHGPKHMEPLSDHAKDQRKIDTSQGHHNFQVDGMGIVVNDGLVYSLPEDEESLYFGQSSTYNFVHQAQRILRESNRSFLEADQFLDESYPSDQYAAESTRRRVAAFDDYVLPPKKEADGLMAIFWSRVYPLYPFLDQSTFQAAYEDLWASNMQPAHSYLTTSQYYTKLGPAIDDIPESRRFHILLNAIFAVCSYCEVSDTRERQIQRGALFWKRWKRLLQLDFDIFNRPRLIFIQALLYSAVYLQSSSELTGACWNLTSIAVRMAQALGLHCHRKSPTWQQKRGVETCCLRWRTWAGCVLMDRRSATIYGRPPMTTSRTAQWLIPSELAIQRESLTESDRNAVTFLSHSVQLQEHLSDIVTKFYDETETDTAITSWDGSGSATPWPPRTSNKQGSTTTTTTTTPYHSHHRHRMEMDDFVAVEAALVSWESKLPDSLRLPELAVLRATPEKFRDISRQAVVLRGQ
ncbi:uncharacterized protein A1O5_09228 [Cladophialophora psammophila CBS 110553]|uniref:Xylanolytic transcriptional activator regulatory domain-containing protein n=1 Tax=Cladophialophora psammophila CBS 110553 TaxID=1182543 RepID=W9WTD0_9EURO|nr:uncharacterized protein A1O5_09228 [Cladophialophora psammophila CBS 110553]EXJ67881.1 hypothetical protein A1O5_09228 [Cladophialophora psammophila CBS 110553]